MTRVSSRNFLRGRAQNVFSRIFPDPVLGSDAGVSTPWFSSTAPRLPVDAGDNAKVPVGNTVRTAS